MGLVLADTPLYIVFAIMIATTAIVSSDIREPTRLLPRPLVNIAALLLVLGTMVNGLQIVWVTLESNDHESLGFGSVFHMLAHSATLLTLLVIMCLWYSAVAVYKPSPAILPTNPPSNTASSPEHDTTSPAAEAPDG